MRPPYPLNLQPIGSAVNKIIFIGNLLGARGNPRRSAPNRNWPTRCKPRRRHRRNRRSPRGFVQLACSTFCSRPNTLAKHLRRWSRTGRTCLCSVLLFLSLWFFPYPNSVKKLIRLQPLNANKKSFFYDIKWDDWHDWCYPKLQALLYYTTERGQSQAKNFFLFKKVF